MTAFQAFNFFGSKNGSRRIQKRIPTDPKKDPTGSKNGSHRIQKWIPQDPKMDPTGSKNGSHRIQKWIPQDPKMDPTGSKNVSHRIKKWTHRIKKWIPPDQKIDPSGSKYETPRIQSTIPSRAKTLTLHWRRPRRASAWCGWTCWPAAPAPSPVQNLRRHPPPSACSSPPPPSARRRRNKQHFSLTLKSVMRKRNRNFLPDGNKMGPKKFSQTQNKIVHLISLI